MFPLFLVFCFLPLIVADCPANTFNWPDDPPFKCYSFVNTPTSFDKAELACNSVGGHLTSVHSGFENTFLHRQANSSFTSSSTADFWIGGKKLANSNTWNWTDGTPFDFTEWQDSDSGNNQACTAELLSTGRWNAVDCGLQKPYVCKSDEISDQSTSTKIQISTTAVATTTPLSPSCSSPWFYFDNTCYYWADDATWQNGEASCAKNDSHLISIHSVDEINFVKTLHNSDFWTGLYTNSTTVDWNSTWHYTDNSVVDYIPWVLPYYPSHNGFQCVRTSGANFTNIDCSTVSTVFCKKPAVNAVTTTPWSVTTPKPVGNCLNGWSYYSETNSCYIGTYAGNFTTLESYCQTFNGGHLSSFKDANELNFIYSVSQTPYYAWVGLYSDDNAVTWKFTDGTPFNYRPWASGYPIRGGVTCATTYYGQNTWNYFQCGSQLIGVCKMPTLNN